MSLLSSQKGLLFNFIINVLFSESGRDTYLDNLFSIYISKSVKSIMYLYQGGFWSVTAPDTYCSGDNKCKNFI